MNGSPCTISYYRGWVKHSETGCRTCKERIRAYNRDAKKRQRDRDRPGGFDPIEAYNAQLRAKTVRDAVKYGVRKAAHDNDVPARSVNEWLRGAGKQAARPRYRRRPKY